jgi:Protein of unknown function (DUF3987)
MNPDPAATNGNLSNAASRALRDRFLQRCCGPFSGYHGKCPNCGGTAEWEAENPTCLGSEKCCTPDEIIGALLLPRSPGKRDSDGALGAIPRYPVEVLPTEARRLVENAAKAGLPEALVGGAALAAMAAAIGGNAQLEVTGSWTERAILWIPLIAPRGAGKSPAQGLAFGPLRDHDTKAGDEGQRALLDDMTLEALARELSGMNGSGAFDLDELSMLLRGLGEYKNRSGDRGRFLKLWTGAPWIFKRVGTGKATNAVRLHVDKPTVVICGGLQPYLHDLLGPDDDGMRPRWLPHLAGMSEPMGVVNVASFGWHTLIAQLLDKRSKERCWQLTERIGPGGIPGPPARLEDSGPRRGVVNGRGCAHEGGYTPGSDREGVCGG